MSVYVALTDGRGSVDCLLRMTSLDNNEEIFSLPGNVDFKDPTGVAEMVLQIQQLRLPRAGDYSIEFLANGEPLGSRVLRVQTTENSQ